MFTHGPALPSGERRVPLNAMQRLMRRWACLHPYNALDVAELRDEVNVDRLEAAARRTLAGLGLSTRSYGAGDRHVTWSAVPAEVEVARLALASDGLAAALAGAATRELNRPFPAGPAPPVRFLVLPAGDSTHVGLAFDHAVLDGVSAAYVFERTLARALGLDPAPHAMRLGRGTYRGAFGARVLPRLPAMLAGSALRLLAMRTCHSPACGSRDDLGVEVEPLDLPERLLPALKRMARAADATVNDVLLAALATALDRATADRHGGRRHRLALGTIADLRKLRPELLADELGVYLGYFNVLLPDPPGELATLLAELTRRTRGAKRALLGCLPEIWAASALWPLVLPARRARWHANQVVLAGGISNLVLPAEWWESLSGRLVGYRRAVPTGPIVPVALGVTTVGERFSLALTWRRTGYSPAQRRQIAADLREALERVAG